MGSWAAPTAALAVSLASLWRQHSKVTGVTYEYLDQSLTSERALCLSLLQYGNEQLLSVTTLRFFTSMKSFTLKIQQIEVCSLSKCFTLL